MPREGWYQIVGEAPAEPPRPVIDVEAARNAEAIALLTTRVAWVLSGILAIDPEEYPGGAWWRERDLIAVSDMAGRLRRDV